MEKMNEQISLFDSDIDKRYQFYGHYCNDDWSTKTAMVNGVSDIVMSFSIELTKVELKKICRDAIKIVRFCLLYTSPSPRDYAASRMPSSA